MPFGDRAAGSVRSLADAVVAGGRSIRINNRLEGVTT